MDQRNSKTGFPRLEGPSLAGNQAFESLFDGLIGWLSSDEPTIIADKVTIKASSAAEVNAIKATITAKNLTIELTGNDESVGKVSHIADKIDANQRNR